MLHAGIDFGAKRSGNTAICLFTENEWLIQQTKKDADADKFVEDIIGKYDIHRIFIDAPLSLPGVYGSKTGYSDYFYREADREARAMSPMFLGGLTARAIRLRDLWVKEGREVIEAYPAGLVRELDLGRYYKKDIPAFMQSLIRSAGMELPVPENWHQADAILAWITGHRFRKSIHQTVGNPREGLICY